MRLDKFWSNLDVLYNFTKCLEVRQSDIYLAQLRVRQSDLR